MRVAAAILIALVLDAAALDAVPAAVAAPSVATAAPALPAAAPVTAAPVIPTAAPSVATAAPVLPTAAPVLATAAPVLPAAAPVTAAPVIPTAAPSVATAAAATVLATAAPVLPAAAPGAAAVAPAVAAPTVYDLSQCGVVVPPGKWAPGVVREAVLAGITSLDVTVPRKGAGFNRTVALDGICLDTFSLSTRFVCASQKGEFRATLKAPGSEQLKFGAATCMLTSISVYKTSKASQSSFKAEMRLEFDQCMNAPVSNAAVVVGLEQDPVADFNMLKWTQEVCKIPAVAPVVTSQITSVTDYQSTRVGEGKCSNPIRRELPDMVQVEDCKLACVANASKARLLGGVGCKGYAYNEQDKTCNTYSGNVVEADKASGWMCYNISYTQGSYAKSTPAPPTRAPDASQLLHFKEALGSASSASMEEILSPTDKPNCFAPLWFFRLEDRTTSQSISVKVKQADWANLMKTLPDPDAKDKNGDAFKTAKVSTHQIIDRVLVSACTKSSGWGSQTCFTAPPKKTECRNEEITGAILSGLMTSVLTWAMVVVWFCVYLRCFGSKGGYQAAHTDESGQGGSKVCTHSFFQMGMIIVAAGGACLACWLSMQFLDAIMRSSDCYNFTEFLVVIASVVLSVALSIIIFSLYMAKQHPSHPHPFLHPQAKSAGKTTKLKMIEVTENDPDYYHPNQHPMSHDVQPDGSMAFQSHNSSQMASNPAFNSTVGSNAAGSMRSAH